MIEIGNIVTLENGKDFLLLEEINLDGKRYVYSVRVLEDETPTSEYVIYQAINTDDGDAAGIVALIISDRDDGADIKIPVPSVESLNGRPRLETEEIAKNKGHRVGG